MPINKLTNGRILHITPGRVNLPVVEDIKDEDFLNTAILGSQYKQMLACLDLYVKCREKGGKNEDFHIGAPNNVFTFVGERGSEGITRNTTRGRTKPLDTELFHDGACIT